MGYLIDTNIISEIHKGPRCDPNVAAWYDSVDSADVFLSVLVLGEIRKGVERARMRALSQADNLAEWLANLKVIFADRILNIDEAVADEWGRMASVRPVPAADALLAATAKVHGHIFVTRNTADVAGLDADVLNPFERR